MYHSILGLRVNEKEDEGSDRWGEDGALFLVEVVDVGRADGFEVGRVVCHQLLHRLSKKGVEEGVIGAVGLVGRRESVKGRASVEEEPPINSIFPSSINPRFPFSVVNVGGGDGFEVGRVVCHQLLHRLSRVRG